MTISSTSLFMKRIKMIQTITWDQPIHLYILQHFQVTAITLIILHEHNVPHTIRVVSLYVFIHQTFWRHLNNPDKLYRNWALFANSKTCDVTIVIKFLETLASFSLPYVDLQITIIWLLMNTCTKERGAFHTKQRSARIF